MPLLRQPLLVLVFLLLSGLLSLGSAVAGPSFPHAAPCPQELWFAEGDAGFSPSHLALDGKRDPASAPAERPAALALDRASLPAAVRSEPRAPHSGEWRYREGRRPSGQRSLGLPCLWCGDALDAVAASGSLRSGQSPQARTQALIGSLVTQHIRLQV